MQEFDKTSSAGPRVCPIKLKARSLMYYGVEGSIVAPSLASSETEIACDLDCPGAISLERRIVGHVLPHIFDREVCGMTSEAQTLRAEQENPTTTPLQTT